MTFFVLSDNYDEGLDCEEYETEAQMIEALRERGELGGSLERIDTVIEGRELSLNAVLDIVKRRR